MGLMIMIPLLVLLIVLFSLLARALIAIWIYRDAENRDMNPLLWSLLIVFTSVIIVLIVYVIVKKPRFDSKQGIGLLITGCVLTVISFIMAGLLFVSVTMGLVSEINNRNYQQYDNMYEDNDFEDDF